MAEGELMVAVHHFLREERISDSGKRINCKYTDKWLQEDIVSKGSIRFHRD